VARGAAARLNTARAQGGSAARSLAQLDTARLECGSAAWLGAAACRAATRLSVAQLGPLAALSGAAARRIVPGPR